MDCLLFFNLYLSKYINMKYITTLFICFSLFASGCAVKLVSDYDEITDQSISNINSHISSYLYEPTTPEFGITDDGMEFYKSVRQEIRNLKFRAKSIPNNEITLKQLDILEDQIDLFEIRDADGYLPEENILFASYFEQTCGAILKFEIAKKRE